MITTSNATAFGGSSSASSSSTSNNKSSANDSTVEQNNDKSLGSDELVTLSGEVKKSSAEQKTCDKKQINIFAGYGAAAGVILGAAQTFMHGCLSNGWKGRDWAIAGVVLPVFTGLGAGIGAIAAKATQKNRDANENFGKANDKETQTDESNVK